jgi:hypothetical protein
MTPLPKAAKQRTVSVGAIVAIAVASSVITSVATTWILSRNSFNSAELNPAAAKTSAATNIKAVDFTIKSAVPRKPVYEPTIEDIDPHGLNDPNGAPDFEALFADQADKIPASGVLDLIKIVRDNSTGYFGGGKHAALNNDLRAVQRASNSLLQNNGNDDGQPALTLATTIDRAIARLGNISGRETETPESVQVSLAIKAKLEEIRAGLPQSK